MRFFILTCFLFLITVCSAQKSIDKAKLAADFDKILSTQFKSDGPGCAALVAYKGEIIYKKAFGLANIENAISMKPDMIFRIGSITKQFTAIAILRLMEQGKLDLQDELTKYLPDYPVNGKKITIEHLLTHTSGIKSYTGMEEFNGVQGKDMKVDELVAFFKNAPMDFDPGIQWKYNNSGYVLLGAILEKITGKPYGEYIEETIFKPLGMKNSLYGSNAKIIPNRASGYDPGKTGVQNAAYLSMTLPYAAGSLMSSVEDLYKWNRALRSNQLVKKETLEKAFTGYKLQSGRNTNYGYGWTIGDIGNHRVIEHSGGIPGYLSDALYAPEDDIFIAVLSNCTCNAPDGVLQKMTATLLEVPMDFNAIAVDSTVLKQYNGVFENEIGETRIISAEGNQLFSQRKGGSRFKISAYEKDKFFFENSASLIHFVKDGSGKLTGLEFKSGITPYEYWKKVDKESTVTSKEIKVDEKILNSYVGEYELSPTFTIVVSVKAGALKAQATGQQEFDLFAESETRFFLKVVEVQMDFVKNAQGKVTHLVLHQGGQEVKANKVK
jgi:CubicO group peptidase (beta-lactamase class C family)